MSGDIGKLLFEAPYRGELWRFTLSSYGGTLRLNVRAFWQADTGDWRPSSRKSCKGFTMPLEAMQRLAEALTAASRSASASGLPGAS